MEATSIVSPRIFLTFTLHIDISFYYPPESFLWNELLSKEICLEIESTFVSSEEG